MNFLTLQEALEICKTYYQLDIPFALEGTHGIGKSQGIQKICKDLNIGFVDLRLTLLEETDLIGLPYQIDNKTYYAKPLWLNMIEETRQDRGILSLEEINRADRLVRQPVLQMLWDRQCLHWKLPKGWLPVATWNPSGESYETVDLDPALLSRLIVLPIKCDVDSWLEWAATAEIHKDIISYVQEYPIELANNGLTPRHWDIVSKIYSKYPEKFELLEPILKDTIASFKQFIFSKQQLPTATQIFEEWNEILPRLQDLVKMPGYLNSLNDIITSHVIKLYKQQKFDESNMNIFQNYLEMIHPDASFGALELLKRKDSIISKHIISSFEGNPEKLRTKTISLMKHLFADV